MTVTAFATWLVNSPVGSAIASSSWLFPTIETLHVIFLTLVVGSVAIFDLRLLGLRYVDRPFSILYREVVPWTWTCYGVAALFGALLFSSNAVKYLNDVHFRLKFLFMALAGLNMLMFHLGIFRKISLWDADAMPPLTARIAGGVSLALWIGVVFMGRWVGFSMAGAAFSAN